MTTKQRTLAALAVVCVAGGLAVGASHMQAVSVTPKKAAVVWVPIYDQSIDPAAPPGSIWLLVNPRAEDCAAMVALVTSDDLASEAVYDPASPCVRLGYTKAGG